MELKTSTSVRQKVLSYWHVINDPIKLANYGPNIPGYTSNRSIIK